MKDMHPCCVCGKRSVLRETLVRCWCATCSRKDLAAKELAALLLPGQVVVNLDDPETRETVAEAIEAALTMTVTKDDMARCVLAALKNGGAK